MSERRAHALALARALATRRSYLSTLFGQQRAVVFSRSRFVVATCGRRAGKTVTAAGALARALERCGYDEHVAYGARTRGVAKGLIWAKLKAIARSSLLPWKFNETERTVTTPAGGTLWVVGFDKSAEIDKLRGLKLRLFVGDEPATYDHLLRDLLREVVEPALGDLRGQAILFGTPGPVCAGTWHEISTGKRKKWEHHRWTIRENPYFPEPDEYLREVLEENGWTEDEPTYQREYLARWARDEGALVYRYLDSRNGIDEMPADYDPRTWTATLGVDFGWSDECGFVAWSSPRRRRQAFMTHASKDSELLHDEIADRLRRLISELGVTRLVGDPGGGGAAFVGMWNRRWAGTTGLTMQNAQKTEKLAAIRVLNSDYASGTCFVLRPACQAYIGEAESLPWANPQLRDKEHPAYANHCCDAGLYAHRDQRFFWHEAPEISLDPRDPDQVDLWARRLERQEATEGQAPDEPDWARY